KGRRAITLRLPLFYSPTSSNSQRRLPTNVVNPPRRQAPTLSTHQHRHFDRRCSQPHREHRSGEIRCCFLPLPVFALPLPFLVCRCSASGYPKASALGLSMTCREWALAPGVCLSILTAISQNENPSSLPQHPRHSLPNLRRRLHHRNPRLRHSLHLLRSRTLA